MSNIVKLLRFRLSYPKIVLSIFGQAHYFLIAIFLFKHDLIDELDSPLLLDFDFYFILLLSVLFSITWFLMNISLTTVLLFLSHDKKYEDGSAIFINTMFYSIAYLTISLVLNYFMGLGFKHFVVLAYSFLALKIVWNVLKGKFKITNNKS
ncbi:hypothetical protein NHF50_09875 [Flavobacterium sp. NRK F10]|uniref:Uncharacterized protein n=2 Tax=Flavobacterium sediminis TaxID=2201181 RepID=A0A2U8QW77_9FLAO|nr:hypothetical protein [Flavobacterium sp. NRK F10]AWM14154.1 hypothetical protein DI487_10050 [Flavobacterium sediminis]MCO6175350.1 hypothetical protein [Flavobacterium sp. NRK F10]